MAVMIEVCLVVKGTVIEDLMFEEIVSKEKEFKDMLQSKVAL